MTKFSPLHGAPIWDECANGTESGEFIEDWRLMNCLNFVFLPEGFPVTRGDGRALQLARQAFL
jgi:anaerobic magnesium-protoporphyrin IX monomethyl ester cyclase